MKRPLAALILNSALVLPTLAQTTGTPADHDALRKLKAEVVEAVNTRNYARTSQLMARPFTATVVTQDSFTDAEKMNDYFRSLFTRSLLGLKSATIQADAEDLSTFLEGPVAIAKGATKERYEMKDGRFFELDGRWTATAVRQDGQWKVAAVHTGVNFLDNPVIGAIEKSVAWIASAAAAAGAVIGALIGWWVGRRRSAKPV